MAKKVIYFVRHGETVLNAQGIRQGAEGSLSDRGREQALQTAKKFPKHRGRPQIILASPFERAKETAEIISRELHLDIKYSPLLVERKNPSEIIGLSRTDPRVKAIVDRIDNGFHEDDLRYSDEENFTDLRARAKAALAFIAGRRERRIIVVTHSIFLQMLVAYMLYPKKLTASEYNKLAFFNPIDNAALTICTFTPHLLRRDEWKLLVWNDEMDETPEELK
jgi:probable phosphoglycerate mutase